MSMSDRDVSSVRRQARAVARRYDPRPQPYAPLRHGCIRRRARLQDRQGHGDLPPAGAYRSSVCSRISSMDIPYSKERSMTPPAPRCARTSSNRPIFADVLLRQRGHGAARQGLEVHCGGCLGLGSYLGEDGIENGIACARHRLTAPCERRHVPAKAKALHQLDLACRRQSPVAPTRRCYSTPKAMCPRQRREHLYRARRRALHADIPRRWTASRAPPSCSWRRARIKVVEKRITRDEV